MGLHSTRSSTGIYMFSNLAFTGADFGILHRNGINTLLSVNYMEFSENKKWKRKPNKMSTKQSAPKFNFNLKEMTDIDNVCMMNERGYLLYSFFRYARTRTKNWVRVKLKTGLIVFFVQFFYFETTTLIDFLHLSACP